MRIELWGCIKFLLGIGPIEVVTYWEEEKLLVEEKCLVTGRALRRFVVEFDWPTSSE